MLALLMVRGGLLAFECTHNCLGKFLAWHHCFKDSSVRESVSNSDMLLLPVCQVTSTWSCAAKWCTSSHRRQKHTLQSLFGCLNLWSPARRGSKKSARLLLDFKGAYRGPYTEVRAAKSRALEKGAVGPACQSPFGGSWAVYGTVLSGELCMQLYGYKPAALRKAFSLTLKREVWEALQAVLKRVLARPGGRIARALHQTT